MPQPGATTQQAANPAAPSAPGAAPATAPAVSKDDLFSLNLTPGAVQGLQNTDLKLAFTEQGGKLTRGEVSSHRVTIKKDAAPIAPLNAEEQPLTFATLFTDPSLKLFSDAKYETEAAGDKIIYRHSAGQVAVEKEYRLTEKGHFVDAKFRVKIPAGDKREWGYLLVPVGAKNLPFSDTKPLEHWEAVAYQNGAVKRHNQNKLPAEEILQGNTGWVAFGNRYFANAIVHQAGINPDVVFTQRADFQGVFLRYPLVAKAGEDQIETSLRLYVGPKEYSELSQVEGMKGLIDYGFFKIFAYPLLELLRFFYRIFHNYGIAIILLTLVVRALFYPLSLKSYRSMKSMQKLQPQIQALREKYKDDMGRFNQEQMALFKSHKVNPMGGCLPMLVQLPVFFALYTVLQNSIELFHAPFFGWIHDLSDKDPLYILPILMGISMFFQQKMTPAAGLDPMQAKMMLAMPVIFTFIMLNLPSGLTLYIFLSTLMGILQQLLINREGNATGKLAVSRT
jgi:YidC/Oxa1 family membrane protein insertase